MGATVRLGTCSWADEGLLKAWYPRGVSSAAARLRYYAERFDVVYILYSFSRNERVRVKTFVADGYKPESSVGVHLTAAGERLLAHLAALHRTELRSLATVFPIARINAGDAS